MSKMKPILFNVEMVRTILDGRKTVTRRIVKPQPTNPRYNCIGWLGWDDGHGYKMKSSYEIGDILYVRETWRVGAWNENDGQIAVDFKADGFARKEWIFIEDYEQFNRYWIQSTEDAIKAGIKTDENDKYHWNPGEGPTRWRPSIHMPKKAARIFLKVTDVRVERLQEITEEQAQAEGVNGIPRSRKLYPTDDFIYPFIGLWNSTIKRPDLKNHRWYSNPFVWVIEFERCDKPEDDI